MTRIGAAIAGTLRLLLIVPLLAAAPLQAGPVGERLLTAAHAPAAQRNADGSTRLNVTLWYPAAPEPAAARNDAGAGSAAAGPQVIRNAAPADWRPRPAILLSHGFGGAAAAMRWFAAALAANGYVVISVDHPGNNGREPMTKAAAGLFFERPGDLRAAFDRIAADRELGRLIDRKRVGVAGFSAGGFTALGLAGGRIDPARLRRFCSADPSDGVCRPQMEFPVTIEEVSAILETESSARRLAVIRRTSPGFTVRAAFVMAPAIVQSFDPESLGRIRAPTAFVLGGEDEIAPNRTNGLVAASLVRGSRLRLVEGAGHYDFVGGCGTPPGGALPFCKLQRAPIEAQRAAVEEALKLFGSAFGRKAPGRN